MESGGGVDIIFKGHGGEMEVVGVGLMGEGGEGRRDEPRAPAEVSCETQRLGRRPSAAGFNQMAAAADGWTDGRGKAGRGVIKKQRERERKNSP